MASGATVTSQNNFLKGKTKIEIPNDFMARQKTFDNLKIIYS